MAVVGEAHILVRAITTGLKKDIEKGFQGVKGATEAAGKESSSGFSNEFAKGLKKFNNASQGAASSFHKLMRRANIFQAGIGVAASSLSALVGALGAFAGAAGGAAASGVALVGVMAQLKVATMVGKMAFKGVMEAVKAAGTQSGLTGKTIRELREEMQQLAFSAEEAALSEEKASLSLEKARENLARVQNLPPDNRARREAELAYQEADLAYRQAKDKHSDLMEQINDPQKKSGGAGAQDPYKDLTATQKAFAIYLKGIMPKMKSLREAAASSFLPELTKQMDAMMKNGFFQLLVTGFERVSQGLAEATKNFAGSAFDGTTKGSLAHFFESSRGTVGALGKVLGNMFKAFLGLMQAADPLIKRFVNFLDKKSFGLAESVGKNQGPLTTFFRNAGDAAASLGKIFGNVFKGLTSLITANIGPGSAGQGMLDWMAKGSEKWAQLQSSVSQNNMNNYFSQAVENFKSMWNAISGFASIFASLGNQPGVKEFWDTIAAGSGSIEKILMSMTAAGPGLADLISKVVEIVALFSDTKQIQAYIAVLTDMFRWFLEIGKMIKPIADALGPVIGVVGALVTSFLVLKKVTMIVYGTIYTFGKGLMFLRKAFMAIKAAQVAYTAAVTANTVATGANKAMKNAAIASSVKEAFMTSFGTKAKEKESLALATATIARQAQIITALEASGANGVLAASEVGVGTAATAAVPPVATLGATLMAAILPVLPIILAVVAAIALIVGAVAIFNAVQAKEAEDAQKRVGEAIKANVSMGKDIESQTIHAQNTWTAAISSTSLGTKSLAADVTNLHKQTKTLQTTQKSGWDWFWNATSGSEDLKEGLKNMGTQLGKLAKKDLKGAQQEFIRFANAQGASREELTVQMREMPEFQDELTKTAEKYGLLTDAMDENQKAAVLVDVATNSGAYAKAKAAEATENFNQKIREAASTFMDFEGPLQQNSEDVKKWAEAQAKHSKSATDTWKDYWDGQSFSLDKYMADLNAQVKKQVDWASNISMLQGAVGQGLISQDTLNDLKLKGAAGADLVDSLAKKFKSGTASAKADLKKFQAATETSKLFSDTNVASGLTDVFVNPKNTTVLDMATAKVGKQAGGIMAGEYRKEMEAKLKAGKVTLQQIMKDQGIKMEDISKEVQKLKIEADVTVKYTGDTDGKKLGGMIGYKLGGMIPRYANGKSPGSFQMFPNGILKGPGGPRSDSILARVSRDEMVVNAESTRRNKDVLNYINKGGVVSAGGGGNYNLSFVVNASDGMDETQVARIVLRQLDRTLGLGASK
jgi:hypothetical protein